MPLFLFTALLLFSLWIVFSGRFDAFHLILGAASSLLVALFSHDLFLQNTTITLGDRLKQGVRFLGYAVWLIGQIVVANLSVLVLVFRPNLKQHITPTVYRFKTRLTDDFAKFVFATSITLTPGTITIRIVGDEFVVHGLTRAMAESLPGDMEQRLIRVFEPNLLRT